MRIQRNELFEYVLGTGLDPTDFVVMDGTDGTTFIDHSPTRSSFAVRSNEGTAYWGETSIGSFGPYDYGPLIWDKVLVDAFRPWLVDVKVETDTPDMWEQLRHVGSMPVTNQIQPFENTQFSSAEQDQISAQLRQIKESLKAAHSLSGEQLAHIEARLDEAEEASHRIGRKDWQLLFYGLLLTLVVGDLVSPDIVHHIFLMAVHGLDNIFGGQAAKQLPPEAQ